MLSAAIQPVASPTVRSARPDQTLPGAGPVVLGLILLALLAAGCAGRPRPPLDRPFVFGQDTLVYPNELIWEYQFDDDTGEASIRLRKPSPDYSHHCFVVARSVRQFFQFAEFDPFLPRTNEETYRTLVRAVLQRDPARDLASEKRVVIPGYPHLNAFSRDHEAMLKQLCGGSWQSYFQRGHWRMIIPFSRQHQWEMAEHMIRELDAHRPPVVHLTLFPSLRMNHAVVITGYTRDLDRICFAVYDPNAPGQPTHLTVDREEKTFCFPRNAYFLGGPVDLYPVYDSLFY